MQLGHKVGGVISDSHNPHVLGLNAREIFFLDDKVILVEGQEDVIFYRKMANQLELAFRGDFFGWGAGGAEKIELFASILKGLGFRKVVGILDGNKTERAASLSDMFPGFKFMTIPADDVRTKPAARARAAVAGFLDFDGRLPPERESAGRKLVEEVNAALK